MDDIVCALVDDTEAPGPVVIVAHDSKVGVVGGSKLSRKFTVVPTAFACAVAALMGATG